MVSLMIFHACGMVTDKHVAVPWRNVVIITKDRRHVLRISTPTTNIGCAGTAVASQLVNRSRALGK